MSTRRVAFNTSLDAERLRAFLATQVARTGNTASLLEAAESWLACQGIMRPMGRTTLERMVYQARHEAEEELFLGVADQLTPAQREQLDALCQTDQGKSLLASLIAPPHDASVKAIRDECQRLEVIRAALPGDLDWLGTEPPRLFHWAAIVRRLSSQALRRYPSAKRYTLLLAFLVVRSQEITDTIVEMFDTLIGRMFARAEADLRDTQTEQAQVHLASARLFRRITQVLLDTSIPSETVREEIFQRIPRKQVGTLVEQSQSLDQSQVEIFFALLKRRYPQMREFTRLVLQALRFGSPDQENPVLEGLETLRTMDLERRKKVPKGAPLGFVPQRWLRAVVGPKGVERRAWELVLLFQTRQALRSGEITVEGSQRYGNWERFLSPKAVWWQQCHKLVDRSELPEDGATYLARVKADLHTLETSAARAFPEHPLAQIQQGKLLLAHQEQLQTPPAATAIRRALTALLPRPGLPTLLMEVDSWTPFTSAFVHLTARREPTDAQQALLRPALLAVLVASATNTSLTTMSAASGIPYGQLVRVHDWYMREETLLQANKLLMEYQHTLRLGSAFGTGALSIASVLRFETEAAASAANPQTPFSRRGNVILASQSLDQGPQMWLGLVNPLFSETAFLLDGLVAQPMPAIVEHTTDLPGVSDLLFGLADLLGYRLVPQPHSLAEQPLSRAREDACYGPLNQVLRQSTNDGLILAHWEELSRLAASLKNQAIAPSLLISRFQAMQRPEPIQQALEELGRLARTRALLSYLEDASLRQRLLMGLNRAKSLEALAAALFFGKQGRFVDRGDEARLTRALALGVVINAIVVWNTFYLEVAARTMARRGQPVPESIWPYLSPILWEHVHLIGEYRFDPAPPHAGSKSA